MQQLFTNRKLQAIILVICCLALNLNTLKNKYALDDEIVIGKNMYVQEGFAGIGSILTGDAFRSLMEQANAASPLSQGRYRPLSIVSFAVEQQLFGTTHGREYMEAKENQAAMRTAGNVQGEQEATAKLRSLDDTINADNDKIAFVRHLFQILWYATAILALFWFISYCFPGNTTLPFVSALLFVFHPVHTEVIANIKSRDEIFSLLFISLTFVFFFRYQEEKKNKDLWLGGASLLLALLSKEYALLLFVLLPLGVMLRYGKTTSELKSRWYLMVAGITIAFVPMRYSFINVAAEKNTELLNDPYLLATGTQKLASEIRVLNEYLRLLLFPHPLSSDYSYAHFPYVDFGNAGVWLAMVTWLAIGGLSIYLFIKRHPMAFPLLLFLGFFMMINNLVFDIGATMGERLIFHSSIGFCMIFAWLLLQGLGRALPDTGKRYSALTAVLMVLLVPMAMKTVARNAQWKDDFTLFSADVHTVPNSALVNANVGTGWFNKGIYPIRNKTSFTPADSAYLRPFVDSAIYYDRRAVSIYPEFVTCYMNMGKSYMFINMWDSAARNWIQAAKLYTTPNPELINHARTLHDRGNAFAVQKDYTNAIHYFSLATQVDKNNKEAWNDLGGCQFTTGHYAEAAAAFKKALEIYPKLENTRRGYEAAMQLSGQK